jgi:hypothetical protein
VLIVDSELKKVATLEILQIQIREQGNYEGSSNSMEVAALRKLITPWKDNPLVVGFVRDRDSKASKAIRDSGWNIQKWFDPSHIAKSFDGIWKSHAHQHLRGLQIKLNHWFN